LAKLDRYKNKNHEFWQWKRDHENNNDDAMDPITITTIDKKELFLGIFIEWNCNNNIESTTKEKNNNIFIHCWKKLCDHVFAYESIRQYFLQPNFNGCPLCRSGQGKLLKQKLRRQETFQYNDNEEEKYENVWEASEKENLERIKYLTEYGYIDNINEKNNDGYTPLMLAASEENLDIIRYLLQIANANIDEKNNDEVTALMHASLYGHLNIVKYMIEIGNANINEKDYSK